MPDTQGKTDFHACCGVCENGNRARPRYVVGVFANIDGARGAAEKLRVNTSTSGSVNLLSNSLPLLAHDLSGVTALSLMSCGRLFQQITQHLSTGAAIVVVHAQSPEQQLCASRLLLDSNCDMLLTHDGSHTAHAHAD